jgi:crotonobetainyl-CoA:carnitine CoA-transferase CaiB-like acyl-CoA transferase
MNSPVANDRSAQAPTASHLPAGASARPLEGVRVVEFCQVAAGPFCGMLLADFGAEVIKVEPPEGDGLRQWPPITEGFSENFASLNRGKRSVALDLKNEQSRDFARALVLDADVLIENNRPGVMDRLGLGWDWFRERKASLVFCSISAFGQTGPRAAEGGFDLTIQAAAGIMSVTGESDGEPVKCGVPVSDFTAGLYAAYSIAALLTRVRAGGLGGHIDIPMFSTTLAIAALQTSEYFGTGRNPRKLGSAHPRNAPYQAYRASDRWFVIAAGNNRLWRAVCDVVGAAELLALPRFETPSSRAANQTELAALLSAYFAKHDASTWLSRFAAAGVPAAPINGYAEALADEQCEHLELVQSMRLPGSARTRTVGCPVRLDGSAIAVDTRAPGLNEHEQDLRARHGQSDPAASAA